MKNLPLIVGSGGINAAGRASFHHAFRRMVIDSLPEDQQAETYLALSSMMNLIDFKNNNFVDQQNNILQPSDIVEKYKDYINENTFIRMINAEHFNINNLEWNHQVKINHQNENAVFQIKSDYLPHQIPDDWTMISNKDGVATIRISDATQFLLKNTRKSLVSMAGQIPTGSSPALLYKSQNHPRALTYAIYAASDMLYSSGLDWTQVSELVDPDQIGVYASSATGQMDEYSAQGYISSAYRGKRTSTKQMPFSFPNMPGDFINAYIIGNIGHTHASIGACASFLYNLESATNDIMNGKRRIAIVGSSDAPIQPEVMEGYRAMSALSEDHQLRELDQLNEDEKINFQRACRPFSYNKGFVIGESAQYFLLFDDQLALETGAQIFGSVGGVYINADGYKRSISKPGVGNYISLAKSCALAQSIVGEKNLREHSFVHAHGTGTPQNRVSESHVLDSIAGEFKIHNWPVTAVKSMVGHSIASASADQLSAMLGTWSHSIIPGIKTIKEIADDVYQGHLDILIKDKKIDADQIKLGFVNSKGFGGNNATGLIFSPKTTEKLMQQRYGTKKMQAYFNQNEKVKDKAKLNDQFITQKKLKPLYQIQKTEEQFGEFDITDKRMTLKGYKKSINLDIENPFKDMQTSI